MTAPNKETQYRELMERAWKNYLYVKKAFKSGAAVFDVTQLLSTFMLAVAHPHENEELLNNGFGRLSIQEALVIHRMPHIPFDDFKPRTKPVKLTNPSEERKYDPNFWVGDRITAYRNAIAHGNIAFPDTEEGEDITYLQLTNRWYEQDRDSIHTTVKEFATFTKWCVNHAGFLYDQASGRPTAEAEGIAL